MNHNESFEELHRRLLANHPTAVSEIATRLFGGLCQDLRQVCGNTPPEELVQQAATDALISYFKRPGQYDPTKSELPTYLRMSALGDLRNLLRREKNFREKFQTGVELSQVEGNENTEDESILSLEDVESLRTKLHEVFLDERDFRIALMVIDQERRTEPFAEILEIEHLSLEEQRREVKRHKDRIKQKLRRYGDSIRDQYKPD